MSSKLEIDIRILLTNCEELSKDEKNFWQLKKYIKSLDIMINELKENEMYSSQTSLSDYFHRLQQLKVITNYHEDLENQNRKLKLRKKIVTGDNLVKEVNQIKEAKNISALRKELLNEGSDLRKRAVSNEATDQSMKYYSDIQEKIAEDMLALTRNLKEQTEAANLIIRRDTEVIEKSSMMSDKNLEALGKESETLQHHSSRACNCWKWLMLAAVVIIFIFMVLFMKIMKKKKQL